MRNAVFRVLAGASFVTLNGCSFASVAPVAIHAKPITVDVDAQRTELENLLCKASDSHACHVLTALDASDGSLQSPPQFPIDMPPKIVADDVDIPVVHWMNSECRVVDMLPRLQVPIDLGAAADEAKAALASAHIEDVELAFANDSLTIDLPELTIAIDDGKKSTKVGVIAPHAGGSGASSPVSLVEGGARALLAAVAQGKGDVVVAPPDGASLDLLAGPDGTIERPGGKADVTLAVILDVDGRAVLNESGVTVSP
jgi:hypothetical protein